MRPIGFTVRGPDGAESPARPSQWPTASGGEGLFNPRWSGDSFAHGDAATMMVEAPGADGRTVKFVVEHCHQGKWSKQDELTATLSGGKASAELQLISEIGFPELDENARDEGFLTVKSQPGLTRKTPPGDAAAYHTANPRKRLNRARYKLVIDKLDSTRVSKIDAITVKQRLTENAVGEMGDYQREPSNLEFPDLVVSFRNQHGEESWGKWFEDFVILGKNGQANEKAGTLTLLNDALTEELCTIDLLGLGIYSYTAPEYCAGVDPQDSGAIKAKLYCEQMKVKFK